LATTASTIAEGATVARGTAMRTVVTTLAVLAVLIAPAYAQGRGKGRHSGAQQQTAEQKQKAAETDKAYKAALDRIGDQQKFDPWGNMR
jgi:hypothetical protein